jgi:hypothetical protein
MICRDRRPHLLVENAALAVDIGAFSRSGVFNLGDVSGTVSVTDGAVAFAVHHRVDGGPLVRLACVIETEGERRQVRAVVPTVTTRQRIGTRRWWACPLCGRRVRILYLVPGGEEIGCRVCGGLIHASAALHTSRTYTAHFSSSAGTAT